MLELEQLPGGVVLPVHAHPGARKNGVTGVHAGRLKIAIVQPAEKGRANDALVRVLADAFGWKPAQIQLLSGATSRRKKFLIEGATATEILEQIARWLKPEAGTG